MDRMFFVPTDCRISKTLIGLFSSIAIVAVLTSAALCEVTFPYVAYVSAPQTFARGGPGQQYYPTQQLPQGLALEVYRHDSEGWCAIRPPEGSFCWIAAHEIHRLDQHTAEIAVESAIARVGSSVSPARSAVQVMLHRDERVRLLPAAATDDPRWVRIAPPAGEFRWVAAESVSRTPPLEHSAGVQQASGWMKQSLVTGVSKDNNRGFTHLVQNTVPIQSANSESDIATATPMPSALSSPPLLSAGTADKVEIVAGSPAAAQVSQFSGRNADGSSPPTHAAPRVSTSPRIRFGNSPSVLGPETERVEELQLRLSQVVVHPKEEWQFDQIESEIHVLMENSDSVSEHEHLHELLERIAQFKHVQAGLPSSPPLPGTTVPNPENGQFTGQTSRVRELAELDLKSDDPFDSKSGGPNEPRYDAVGRLKPVASNGKDAPSYALVDDKGAVISFITPTPDLNLQPYLGMRIGVNGSRGFIPEFRKAHVTAGRVTLIEDRIRR